MPADGTPHPLTRPVSDKADPRFVCCSCKTPTYLCDLNDDMLCEVCGEPEEDGDAIDLSDVAMMKEHSTWSV